MTEDEIDMLCDWTDFRADMGVADPKITTIQYKAFTAGWEAARYGSDRGVLR
jgi:hypothetical protein